MQGSRPTPYRVRVRVRRFSAAEWDSVFTAIAARAAHAAALLDGELDPGIVDEAADVGVDLLPGPGELQPRCSCPDWADPCKHSAAVCYLVADVLDADPFGLFLLRGLDRDAVLSGVRHHRSDGPAPGWDQPRPDRATRAGGRRHLGVAVGARPPAHPGSARPPGRACWHPCPPPRIERGVPWRGGARSAPSAMRSNGPGEPAPRALRPGSTSASSRTWPATPTGCSTKGASTSSPATAAGPGANSCGWPSPGATGAPEASTS